MDESPIFSMFALLDAFGMRPDEQRHRQDREHAGDEIEVGMPGVRPLSFSQA
jgi:hypothetical protein